MKKKLSKMIPTLGALTLLIALTPVSYQHDYQLKLVDHQPEGMASPVVTTPFNPQYPINQVPTTSIQTISQIINLPQFIDNNHTSGKGQTIAIIDSGIDVGIGDLQPITSDSPKITQYYDLTQEGLLTSQATSRHNEQITLNGSIYQIGDIANALNQYRLALLPIDTILPVTCQAKQQIIPILITASNTKGYDTLYIDTNQDNDFTNEQPITNYNKSHHFATINDPDYTINLALTQLDRNGATLQLSGDFLGHGTFLAGIISANSAQYQGLAPDSQLIAIKIFDRQGQSSQERLAQALILATQQKVDIINLSLSLPSHENITPALKDALNQVKYANIPIVAAAGNYGGGLHSTAFPANQTQIISTGSYIDPAMWQIDQLLYLEQPFISSFSSRGPNKQNNQYSIFPTLVTPGAVTSTVPSWHDETYMYDEGTSISSAVTTAIIAHLNQYAQANQLPATPEHLTNALAVTATMLNLPNTDQGYGLINLTHIEQALQQQTTSLYKTPYTTPKALFTTDATTNSLQFALTNPDTAPHTIVWHSDAQWVQLPQQTTIKANSTTTINIEARPPADRGQYSTMIHGTILGETIATIHLPINIIQAFPTTQEPINLEIDVPAGQSKSYFITIPENTHLLTAQIDLHTIMPQNASEQLIAMGRCQVTLFDPNGKSIDKTPYIGASYSATPVINAKVLAVDPMPGVWQLIVTSSDKLTMYNHFSSQGDLQIKMTTTKQ